MNWIMSNGRISHFPWQTHRTVSAPFTASHSRSALFNIFRAAALAERRGRGKKTKKKTLLLWRWGTCKWRLRRAVTKDKARSDNACTHRPWAECWCVLTTRRSRNNTEANQRLVPETLYPHFVWQRSVSVTPTGGSKGFTHLDVSEAGYRCRVIWQPAPKLQRRQLLQILRTAFSALRCEAPQLCTDGVKPRCSFELTYAGILCLSAPHLLTLEGLYAGAQNDSMGHFALPLKITCKGRGLFEFRPQRLRSGDDRG